MSQVNTETEIELLKREVEAGLQVVRDELPEGEA